jgi:chorismate mutase / prephenate dehydratase
VRCIVPPLRLSSSGEFPVSFAFHEVGDYQYRPKPAIDHMPDPHWSLDDLRRQIDEVDDALHDLLMRRADVVAAISSLKKGNGTPALRPGREAAILRRLLARHQGPFPPAMLMRIWREILSGTVAMQMDFAVAVYCTDAMPGYWDLARDHYGNQTRMVAFGTPSQVVRAVTEGAAGVGVLPMPTEGDQEPWWPQLVSADAQSPRVIARLPFAGRGSARGAAGDALAIGRGEPEPTGLDRSLLVVETNAQTSRARVVSAIKAGGLVATFVAGVESKPEMVSNLLEFDGMLGNGDPRVVAALAPLGSAVDGVFLLGCYARPFSTEELWELPQGGARRHG